METKQTSNGVENVISYNKVMGMTGGRIAHIQLQTDYAQALSPLGLKRGKPRRETKAQHQSFREFHRQEKEMEEQRIQYKRMEEKWRQRVVILRTEIVKLKNELGFAREIIANDNFSDTSLLHSQKPSQLDVLSGPGTPKGEIDNVCKEGEYSNAHRSIVEPKSALIENRSSIERVDAPADENFEPPEAEPLTYETFTPRF